MRKLTRLFKSQTELGPLKYRLGQGQLLILAVSLLMLAVLSSTTQADYHCEFNSDGDGIPVDTGHVAISSTERAFSACKGSTALFRKTAAGNDQDSDADGVTDTDEAVNGTNPLIADTDRDGKNDGEEGTTDTDGDGAIDALESILTDRDGDGIADELDSSKVLEYRIDYSDIDQRYHIYLRPAQLPTTNNTLTGQVTIIMPHADNLNVSRLESHVKNTHWNPDSRNNAPTANPTKDYLSFSLSGNGPFHWSVGEEIHAFSFVTNTCPSDVIRLMEPDDKTFEANTDNHGNHFTNLGWGDMVSNNYLGNYGGAGDCRDSDSDGISNSQEASDGTDPNNSDSDGDSLNDQTEGLIDDTDSDGIANALDPDDDGDGVLTLYEDSDGDANPLNDDTDNNGTPDYLDTDDDGDGMPTASEQADPNADGNPSDAVDSDGDSLPDYLDAHSDSAIVLQLRAWLQGAFDGQSMNDKLRASGHLPAQEPFSSLIPNPIEEHQGGETASAALLATTTMAAPVDWVLIELRDADNPVHVLASRAALVQRNGDVVDAQTGSVDHLFTDLSQGTYHVALRHRNHLGVMTRDPVMLSATPTLVDFGLAATPTWGEHARHVIGDHALMRAGDSNHDGKIVTNGPGNDLASLLIMVLSTSENTKFNANYIMPGYYNPDFLLDGKTIFSGASNDSNLAIGNVLLSPGNATMNSNYIIIEQLP